LFRIPKNINKIKNSINRSSEIGENTKKNMEISKALQEMEQRKSVLMSEVS